MSEQVTVIVSGLTGSGKSAIYGEIVLALAAIGVRVEHGDPAAWQAECNMTHADWLTALQLYQPTVTMHEQNMPRGSLAFRDAQPGEGKHRFGSPPEPVVNPSAEWLDAYADWYHQGKA